MGTCQKHRRQHEGFPVAKRGTILAQLMLKTINESLTGTRCGQSSLLTDSVFANLPAHQNLSVTVKAILAAHGHSRTCAEGENMGVTGRTFLAAVAQGPLVSALIL